MNRAPIAAGPDLVVPRPDRVLAATTTGGWFPVRRVYCVGRNYAAHAREMGHDPQREAPFFFQKNPECVTGADQFCLPAEGGAVHHEVELVAALKSGGQDIASEHAAAHIWGYGVGLDMTRRDLQAELKTQGRPWEIAKAFEGSAPLGPLQPLEITGPLAHGTISLTVNGTLRQRGDLDQMIWSLPEQIAFLSRHFTLAAGDLIMTGTPSGVGPVAAGDQLRAEIAGLPPLEITITAA